MSNQASPPSARPYQTAAGLTAGQIVAIGYDRILHPGRRQVVFADLDHLFEDLELMAPIRRSPEGDHRFERRASRKTAGDLRNHDRHVLVQEKARTRPGFHLPDGSEMFRFDDSGLEHDVDLGAAPQRPMAIGYYIRRNVRACQKPIRKNQTDRTGVPRIRTERRPSKGTQI